MEKKIKIIKFIKWICFPMGYLMYFLTADSFGDIIAVILGVAATVGFWALMRGEETRIIGQTLAVEIKEAITSAGNVESFIEIKRIKSGIIARVYLINAREKLNEIHRAITGKLEGSSCKKYLWIMQLTDMPGRGALKETQQILNAQLVEELMKRKGDGGGR